MLRSPRLGWAVHRVGSSRHRVRYFRPGVEILEARRLLEAGLVAATDVVSASNLSQPTLCAEEDNVNIPFVVSGPTQQVESFAFTAFHPAYEIGQDNGAPDFTHCPPSPPILAPISRTKLFDDGETVIQVVHDPSFAPASVMSVRVGAATANDATYLQLQRRIAGTLEYPEVFVLYVDGSVRVKPQPPLGRADTFFGSTVLVGPAVPSSRPSAAVTAAEYRPATDDFLVSYQEGGTATLHLAEVSRQNTRVQVDVDYATPSSVPFATFRSMYVADGNADVDHATWTDSSGSQRDQPILTFPGGEGTSFLFRRVVRSVHNTSAPDIAVGEFQVAEATSTSSLSITQSDSPDPVQAGQTLTWTLTVASTGIANTSVVVTDTLPASVGSIAATASTGSTTVSGNVVTANLGNLAAGSSPTVTITATAPSTATTLTSTAVVASVENPTGSSQTSTENTRVVSSSPILAFGSDSGVASTLQVLDASTRASLYSLSPFGSFLGGVRVAVGDVNGDGQDDVIAAAGSGGAPHVRTFDGQTGTPLPGAIGSFFAYDLAFSGGVHVAAGDVNGDGRDDIITGADAGGGPHVKVFSGIDGALLASFLAYDSAFRGGVRVGAADVNGEGKADVIAGAGPGGMPFVRVFDAASFGSALAVLGEGAVYDSSFTGGVYVGGVGDVNGDGKQDLVVGPGTGGLAVVDTFGIAGGRLSRLAESTALGPGATGCRVGGLFDHNNDGAAEILAAQGPGRAADPVILDAASLALLERVFASIPGGLFVGASRDQGPLP